MVKFKDKIKEIPNERVTSIQIEKLKGMKENDLVGIIIEVLQEISILEDRIDSLEKK